VIPNNSLRVSGARIHLEHGIVRRYGTIRLRFQPLFVDIFSEDRRLVRAGQEGEIGIKSPAATRDYPGLAEQTREAFWNGYFFPGDIGRKDAEGHIYLVGRKSLFINRVGYKVNPSEIEAVVEQHSKVKEAAVIGVETQYGDQKIKAVVVPAEPVDERDIIEFCRYHVADFKVPSVVEFRTELPKSSTGKILRKAI
jgi:long-chain acyl-CoA synthetase